MSDMLYLASDMLDISYMSSHTHSSHMSHLKCLKYLIYYIYIIYCIYIRNIYISQTWRIRNSMFALKFQIVKYSTRVLMCFNICI